MKGTNLGTDKEGMQTKVLLDTDIGSNIDDAVCLAYLLVNPACHLLGITTVSGDTIKRASLASVLCKIAGRVVPIYPGRRQPLMIEQKQTEVPEAIVLDRWEHDTNFSRGEAVEFLRQTIRANPGEVVLLGIGPLTNLAALFAADEEIAGMLKGLVLMCGHFHSPVLEPEWNALLDPVATAMVYGTTPPFHRSIGFDVTLQVTMPAEEVRKRFQTPLLRPVLDFAEVDFSRKVRRFDRITFHDPVAASTIFDDKICGFEFGQVEIELRDERLAGATRWSPHPDGRHEIACSVNAEGFLKHYFDILK